MGYRQYFVPTTKKELIAAIKVHWKGRRTDLYEMSIKRLRGIFRGIRDQQMVRLMRRE